MNSIYIQRKVVFYFAALMLVSAAFCSCEDFFETTLELETPQYEEKLVLSAVLNNNRDKTILISKTVGLNDELDESTVDDATVVLSSDSGDSWTFEPTGGSTGSIGRFNYFLFDPEVVLVDGETYTLEATSMDGNKASSTVTKPETPEIISAKYDPNGGLDVDGDEVSAIDLVFQDKPDVRNFYRVELFISDPFIPTSVYSLDLTSNDPAAIESADYNSLIMEDIQFDGEEYRLRILFYEYNSNPVDSDYFVQFSSITQDQFKFDKLLRSFDDNEDNPFSSPTQLHTNVEGGVGLFAIESSKQITVQE